MRISIGEAAEMVEPPRYGETRVHPFTLGLVIAVHVALIAATLTYRFTFDERARAPAVRTFDLTQPPPPAEPEAPPPEASAIYIPPPRLLLPQPQPPAAMTVTPDPPPVPAPAVQVQPSPPPAPVVAPPVSQPLVAEDLSASVIYSPTLRIPPESRRQREQGTVLLTVRLGTDGRVAGIRVSRSSGYSRLDETALRMVRRWRWSPRIVNGTPVEVTGTVPVTFEVTG